MKIGLISDTHGHIDDRILIHLKGCDEIWHAGDIGSPEVIEKLKTIAPVIMVSGNIDEGPNCPVEWKEIQRIQRNGLKILIIHIAAKPSRYNPKVLNIIKRESPDMVVAGHSHILLVKYDKENRLLFINPGAAGHHGFHKIRTLITFEIINKKPANMQVIELGNRGKLA